MFFHLMELTRKIIKEIICQIAIENSRIVKKVWKNPVVKLIKIVKRETIGPPNNVESQKTIQRVFVNQKRLSSYSLIIPASISFDFKVNPNI